MAFGDETDQKILAILSHGRKQQSEITALLDVSQSTVRNHLEFLTNNHEDVIRKDDEHNKNVYYHLADKRDQLIEPKPSADPEEVKKSLSQIQAELNPSEPTGPFIPTESLHTTVLDLYDITDQHYYVLVDPENRALEQFLEIFGQMVDELRNAAHPTKNSSSSNLAPLISPSKSFNTDSSTNWGSDKSFRKQPLDTYTLFFKCTDNIYANWKRGKENDEFHTELVTRLPELKDDISSFPQSVGLQLQAIALSVRKKIGQEFLIELIKSGKYNEQNIRSRLFYAYDVKNEVDQMLVDLTDAMNDANEEQAESIRELIKKIKQEYKQPPHRS